MQTYFDVLRRHYGTHEAAAEAVGYKRGRYPQFRLGPPELIPLRAVNAITAAAEKIAREREPTATEQPVL